MKRQIDTIVIHCAASPNGKAFTVNDIDNWHKERGFVRTMPWRNKQNSSLEAVGYHFVIGVNGALWTGRHLDETGAHAKGFNQHSVAICMIGTDSFTPAQWRALSDNIAALRKSIPSIKHVIGHRDLPDVHKTCPGFDVAAWLRNNMTPEAGHVLQISP